MAKKRLGDALQKASEISKKSTTQQAQSGNAQITEKSIILPSRQGKKAITGFFD